MSAPPDDQISLPSYIPSYKAKKINHVSCKLGHGGHGRFLSLAGMQHQKAQPVCDLIMRLVCLRHRQLGLM